MGHLGARLYRHRLCGQRGTSLTLNLSGATEAIYFYEEPSQWQPFSMTATDSSGTTVTTSINGDAGSGGVGFYESVAGGPYLTSITVTATDPTGFAIGEFGINSGGALDDPEDTSVPDLSSTVLLLAMGLGGLFAFRRKRVTQ